MKTLTFKVGIVTAALVTLGSGCGSRYHATYTASEVQKAFRQAGFPLDRWSCGPLSDAKTCFDPLLLRGDRESFFDAALWDSDHSASVVFQSCGGASMTPRRLTIRVGNFDICYDTTPAGGGGPALPVWVFPRVRAAAKLLRIIRTPDQ